MKAIAIEGVRKFKTVDIPEPAKDGSKVIIAVKKCGICGSDLHYFQSGAPVDLVMGHEFSGEVVDPGNRTDLNVGDRVTALPISPCGTCEACLKGNPQYCPHTWEHAIGLSVENPGGLTSTIAVRSDMVYKLGENMSFEEGAMVEPMAVGYHAVNLVDIKLSDDVLVIGGGIIGLSAAMFAKSQAHQVILSETNELRGKQAETLNVADKWINPTQEISLESLNVKEGFDVVIECVGNDKAVNSAISLVKPGGTIVLVGVALDAIPVYTVQAVLKELTIKGAIAYTKEEFISCIDLINNKDIEVTKFIDSTVSLDGVQNAYERLTSGTDKAVKIIVDPNLEAPAPAAEPAAPAPDPAAVTPEVPAASTPAPVETVVTPAEAVPAPAAEPAAPAPEAPAEGPIFNEGGNIFDSFEQAASKVVGDTPAPAAPIETVEAPVAAATPSIPDTPIETMPATAEPVAPAASAPAPVETVAAPAVEASQIASAPAPVETVNAPAVAEAPIASTPAPVETVATPAEAVPAPAAEPAAPAPEAPAEKKDETPEYKIKNNIENDIIGIFDN